MRSNNSQFHGWNISALIKFCVFLAVLSIIIAVCFYPEKYSLELVIIILYRIFSLTIAFVFLLSILLRILFFVLRKLNPEIESLYNKQISEEVVKSDGEGWSDMALRPLTFIGFCLFTAVLSTITAALFYPEEYGIGIIFAIFCAIFIIVFVSIVLLDIFTYFVKKVLKKTRCSKGKH